MNQQLKSYQIQVIVIIIVIVIVDDALVQYNVNKNIIIISQKMHIKQTTQSAVSLLSLKRTKVMNNRKANTSNKVSLTTCRHSNNKKDNQPHSYTYTNTCTFTYDEMRLNLKQWKQIINQSMGDEKQSVLKIVKDIEIYITKYVYKINTQIKSIRNSNTNNNNDIIKQNTIQLYNQIEIIIDMLQLSDILIFTFDKILQILKKLTNIIIKIYLIQRQKQKYAQLINITNKWSNYIYDKLVSTVNMLQSCTTNEADTHQLSTCAMKLRIIKTIRSQLCMYNVDSLMSMLIQTTISNYVPKYLHNTQRQTILQYLLQSIPYKIITSSTCSKQQQQQQQQQYKQQQQEQVVIKQIIQICQMYVMYMGGSVLSMGTITLLQVLTHGNKTHNKQQQQQQQEQQQQQQYKQETDNEHLHKLQHNIFNAVLQHIWMSIHILQHICGDELYYLTLLMCNTHAYILSQELKLQIASKWLKCYMHSITTAIYNNINNNNSIDSNSNSNNSSSNIMQVLHTYVDQYSVQSILSCLSQPVQQQQQQVLNTCYIQNKINELLLQQYKQQQHNNNNNDTVNKLQIISKICSLIELLIRKVCNHNNNNNISHQKYIAWLYLMIFDQIVKRVYFGNTYLYSNILRKYLFVMLAYRLNKYLSILYANNMRDIYIKCIQWLIQCITQSHIDNILKQHMVKTLIKISLCQNIEISKQHNNNVWILQYIKFIQSDSMECEQCCNILVTKWINNVYMHIEYTQLHELVITTILNLLHNKSRIGLYSSAYLLIFEVNSSSISTISTKTNPNLYNQYAYNKTIANLLNIVSLMDRSNQQQHLVNVNITNILDINQLIYVIYAFLSSDQNGIQSMLNYNHNESIQKQIQMQDQGSNFAQLITILSNRISYIFAQKYTNISTNYTNKQQYKHITIRQPSNNQLLNQGSSIMNFPLNSHKYQQQQQQQQWLQNALSILYQQCYFVIVVIAAHCVLARMVTSVQNQKNQQYIDTYAESIYRLYNSITNSIYACKNQNKLINKQQQSHIRQFVNNNIKLPLLNKLAHSLGTIVPSNNGTQNSWYTTMLTSILKLFTTKTHKVNTDTFKQLILIKQLKQLYEQTNKFMESYWEMYKIDATQWKNNQQLILNNNNTGVKMQQVCGKVRVIRQIKKYQY